MHGSVSSSFAVAISSIVVVASPLVLLELATQTALAPPGRVAMAHHKQSQGAMGDDGGTLLSAAVDVDDHGQGQGLPVPDEDDDYDGISSSSSPTGNKHNKQTSCLLPARSLRSTDEASHHSQQADGGVRSLSFSKIFSFRMWAPAGSSLSIDQHQLEHDDDYAAASAGAANKDNKEDDDEEKLMKQVCRSQSVPATSVARRFSGTAKVKGSSSRRVADSSSLTLTLRQRPRLRVVPLCVPLHHHPLDQAASATTGGETKEEEEQQEDIAAQEAVCRICMVACRRRRC
ncbi:hypothetical protein VPH35_041159 [Triticum aestivum]